MAGATTASPPVGERWQPWRDRTFLVFASGNTANNIGDAIYAVAVPLLVFDLTGSLALMSVLATFVPIALLFGPVFGVAADRWGPRVLVVPGLLVQAAAALVLNIAAFVLDAPIWVLLVTGALVQFGGGMYRAGWMSGIPTQFPQNPPRARGALRTCFIATTVVGPALAALLVNRMGYELLLWFNMVTFVAPVVVWKMGIHPPRVQRDRTPSSIATELKAGWAILRRSTEVFHVMLVVLPLDFVSSTGTLTIAIFYLRDRWEMSPGGVSAVLMAANAGALLGSVVVTQRDHWPLRPMLLVGIGAITACLLVMPVPALVVFVAAFLVFAVVDSALDVATEMLIYRVIPAEAIGRSNGFWRLIHGIPQFLAPLVISVVAAAIGVGPTFTVLAGVAALSLACLAVQWHALGHRPDPDLALQEAVT